MGVVGSGVVVDPLHTPTRPKRSLQWHCKGLAGGEAVSPWARTASPRSAHASPLPAQTPWAGRALADFMPNEDCGCAC